MLSIQIYQDFTDARKNRDALASALLSTLYAEINKQSKQEGCELGDQEVIAIVKKFVKNAQITQEALKKTTNSDAQVSVQRELDILNSYLPQQLTSDQLVKTIDELVQTINDVGSIMRALKDRYPNSYDSRLASDLVRSAVDRRNQQK